MTQRKRNEPPNNPDLRRVSDDMVATNIVQGILSNDIAASPDTSDRNYPKLINFRDATGVSGNSVRFSLDPDAHGGTATTDVQLTFAAHLSDLGDVDRNSSLAQVGTAGVDVGHILIFDNALDEYKSQQVTGFANLGTGGFLQINQDVLGITHLNLSNEEGVGSILFQTATKGQIGFKKPELDDLTDVDIHVGYVDDGDILVYVDDDDMFHNRTVTGDVIIVPAGGNAEINIVDDAVGLEELNIVHADAVDELILGVSGSGTDAELRYYTRTIDVGEVTGPAVGQTAMMVHNGIQPHFVLGEVPSLDLAGDQGSWQGMVAPIGAPSHNQLLGVATGDRDGIDGDGLVWSWLNPIDIGTGATGIGQLHEVSFTPRATPVGVGYGEIFVGNSAGHLVNLPVLGDIEIDTSGDWTNGVTMTVTNISGIADDYLTNAKLLHKGITLEAGSGLTFTTAYSQDSQINLGQARELKLDINTTHLKFTSSGKLAIKPATIDTSELVDDCVTTIKIEDNAVTTDKIPANAVTNDKLENNVVSITSLNSSGSTLSFDVALGQNIHFAPGGADQIPSAFDSSYASNLNTSVVPWSTSGSRQVSFICRIAQAVEGASAFGAIYNRGVASFNEDHFEVNTYGFVSIKSDSLTGGLLPDDVITGDHIVDDSIQHSHLDFSGTNPSGNSGHCIVIHDDSTFGLVPQADLIETIGLDDISDVDIEGTADGDVLRWNGALSTWTDARLSHTDLSPIEPNKILGKGAVVGVPDAMSISTVKGLLNDDSSSLNADTLDNINVGKFFRADRGSGVTQYMDGPCSIGSGSMILGKGLGNVTDGTDISMGVQGYINASHNIIIGSGESINFYSDSDALKNLTVSDLSTHNAGSIGDVTLSLYKGRVGINTIDPYYGIGYYSGDGPTPPESDREGPGMQIVDGGYRSDGHRNGYYIWDTVGPDSIAMAMVSTHSYPDYNDVLFSMSASLGILRMLITDEAVTDLRYDTMRPENSCIMCDKYLWLQGRPDPTKPIDEGGHAAPRMVLSTRGLNDDKGTRQSYFRITDDDNTDFDTDIRFTYVRGQVRSGSGGDVMYAGFRFRNYFTTTGGKADTWPLWFSPEKYSTGHNSMPSGRHCVTVGGSNLLFLMGEQDDAPPDGGPVVGAGKPGIIIDSPGSTDGEPSTSNYTEQTAFIRLGESAKYAAGAAALNLLYSGDGYSHMFMGPLSASNSFDIYDHAAPFTGETINAGSYRGSSAIIQMYYTKPWVGIHAANGLYLYKDLDSEWHDVSGGHGSGDTEYGLILPHAGIRIGHGRPNGVNDDNNPTIGSAGPTEIIFADPGTRPNTNALSNAERTSISRLHPFSNSPATFTITAGYEYYDNFHSRIWGQRGASSLWQREGSAIGLFVSDNNQGQHFHTDACIYIEGTKFTDTDNTRITIQADEIVYKDSAGNNVNGGQSSELMSTDYMTGKYRYDHREFPDPVSKRRADHPGIEPWPGCMSPTIHEAHSLELYGHRDVPHHYDGPWKQLSTVHPNRRGWYGSGYGDAWKFLGWHNPAQTSDRRAGFGETYSSGDFLYGADNPGQSTWTNGAYRRIRIRIKNMWLWGDGNDKICYQVRINGNWYGQHTAAPLRYHPYEWPNGVELYPQHGEMLRRWGATTADDDDGDCKIVPLTLNQWSHFPMHYNIDVVYDDPLPYIQHSYASNGTRSPYIDTRTEYQDMNTGQYLALSDPSFCKRYWGEFNKLQIYRGTPHINTAGIDGIRFMVINNQTGDDTLLSTDGWILEGLEW